MRSSTHTVMAIIAALCVATGAAARPEPAGFIDTFSGLPPAPATLNGLLSVPTSVLGFHGDEFGPFSWLALGPDWIAAENFGGVGQALRVRVGQTTTQQPDLYANAIVTWPFEDTIRARHTEPMRLSFDLYLPAYGEIFGAWWRTIGSPHVPGWLNWAHSAMCVGGSFNGPDVIRVLAVAEPQVQYYWQDGVFIGSAPEGFSVGDRAVMPLNTWVRFIVEGDFDRHRRFYVDYFDGQGEFLVYADSGPFIGNSTPQVNQVAFGSGRQVLGAQAWFDNHTVVGARRPAAEPPLTCDYHDPLDWLFPYDLLYTNQSRWHWQQQVWAIVSCVFHGQCSINTPGYDTIAYQFQERLGTALPHRDAKESGAWRACVDFTLHAVGYAVRLVSPNSTAADNAASRVFIGHNPQPGVPGSSWDRVVYVQTNPDFSPLNPDAEPPLDFAPQVGVDIESTGTAWPVILDDWITLCMDVDAEGVLSVYINDEHIYTGVAFDTAIHGLALESYGDMHVSEVRLFCAQACPADVTGDGVVDFADFSVVLAHYGQSGSDLNGDTNGDGVVDFTDFSAVLAAYGQTCP